MQSTLGSFLRQLRQSRCLSQSQAAKAAGLGRVTINRWEMGTQQPRAIDLETLLSVFNPSEEERRRALALLDTPQARAQIREGIVRVGRRQGIGPMPRGGDLLRALRMRRGLPQEEAAKIIGVTVRTLRRWENSEVWPSPTQVHTLCYSLNAHTEEMLALTTGELAPVENPDNVSLDELQERGHELHFFVRGWPKQALKELSYLTMEAQAWPVVANSGDGWEVLADLYSYHAYLLSTHGRFVESGEYADRALDLLPTKEVTTSTQVLAGITAARSIVYRGTRLAPQRGLEMLRHWLLEAQWPEYEAWILSDMAAYTTLANDAESGLHLASRAREVAKRCGNRHELYNRELDEAQLLIKAGRPEQALTLMERDRVNPCTDQAAKFLLLEAEAYLDSAEPSPAQDRLEDALQIIESKTLISLEPMAQKLTRRF